MQHGKEVQAERTKCKAKGAGLKESRSGPGHPAPRAQVEQGEIYPETKRNVSGSGKGNGSSQNADHRYLVTPGKGPHLLLGDTVRIVAKRLVVWVVAWSKVLSCSKFLKQNSNVS